MKKIINYITLLLLVFCVFYSCKDMDEVHEEYIKNGEIKYTTKVDSLKSFSGKERVKLTGFISGAFNVDEIIVAWNNGNDIKSFPYSKSENDTDELILDITELEEKSYEFQVYSQDFDGNNSLKVTVFGVVYGEVYRLNLEAREINTFTLNSDTSANISLKPSSELTRSTEFKYTNLSGEEIVAVVTKDESAVVLNLVDIMEPIMYRTYYVPTEADENGIETSIDEFASEWVTYNGTAKLQSILNSLTLESVLGGVNTSWVNTGNHKVKLDFKKTVAGSPVISSLTSSESTDSYTITGMESGQQTVEITLEDFYGNALTKVYNVTVEAAVLLNKSSWSIIDFSSEEDGGEGPVSGYASAVIDGNVNTFWHSAWKNSQPVYPHYFTIDMGSEKTIASFEIFRRQNDGGGANIHEFWISSDNVTYTLATTHNAGLLSNNGVSVKAPQNTKARYVRYKAVAGPRTYTHLAEINMYGKE